MNLIKHIAFIMDGNGRWAESKKLSRNIGHSEGLKVMRKIIKYCSDKKIPYVSFYSFSKENWFRTIKEIYGIFNLIKKYGDTLLKEWGSMNIKVKVVGDKHNLPFEVVEWINAIEYSTKNNNGMNLNIVANYSGRKDMIQAFKNIMKNLEDKTISPVDINEQLISNALYTQGVPDPDICIRTGKEYRLSNFFLWQMAYTELFFLDVFWPDFTEEHIENVILNFHNRERRFGGII